MPRTEQTTESGDIRRIEKGRELAFNFIDLTQTQNVKEVTLMLASYGLELSLAATTLALLAYAF